MKNNKLFVCILGAVMLLLFVLMCMFVISGSFALFMPDLPEPQITYGEFPFIITFERNGEILTYNDVVICEYEGTENLGTGGKKRKWSQKLKSGNEHIVLLQSIVNNIPFEIFIPIPGQPEYYMGEITQLKSEYESVMKDDRFLGYKQNETIYTIKKEEALQKYNVKIISIDCSPPIENKFDR